MTWHDILWLVTQGNINQWWDEASSSSFRDKALCIISEAQWSYSLVVFPRPVQPVHGPGGRHIAQRTQHSGLRRRRGKEEIALLFQGENIADNGGIKQVISSLYSSYCNYAVWIAIPVYNPTLNLHAFFCKILQILACFCEFMHVFFVQIFQALSCVSAFFKLLQLWTLLPRAYRAYSMCNIECNLVCNHVFKCYAYSCV